MAKVLASALFALALLLARPSRAQETVVLWHAYRGDEEKALLAVVRTFEASHPGVTVDVLAVPYEAYAAKLQAAVPRAHGPDLFIEAHQGIGSSSLKTPLLGVRVSSKRSTSLRRRALKWS